MNKTISMTGDRPTGPLHLGHFVGSLQNRLLLQETSQQYIMIADVQALTDNFAHPEKIRNNIMEVVLDYFAVGIDPHKSTIFIQSMIPELFELTIYFMNLVTLSRLKRNPTVKTEIIQKKFGDTVPIGFLTYPISQAADITFLKATLVPIGEDQLPMIEQTNEIVRTFNRIYQCNVLVEAKGIISKQASRLPGIDGKAKMSKSLNNAIYLCDTPDEIQKKVMAMYTDPNHIHVKDPGKIEGNVVFSYLDLFDSDKERIQKLKDHYTKGGLGDVKIKKHLIEVLNTFLDPIRKKRKEYEKNKEDIKKIIFEGTERVREIAQKTISEIRSAMYLNY